jgi:release factor glutamine methyltransferase
MTREEALLQLGRALRASGYRFVTVTPESHRRVHGRAEKVPTLRDVFGWSRPFGRGDIPGLLFDLLVSAGALVVRGERFLSAVRFSSLGEDLFVHSAYPTSDPGAVFFGPDTYRFCGAIARLRRASKRCIDVGCGSGAGGIVAARAGARSVVLADVNEDALSLARVNAALAGVDVAIVRSDVLVAVEGSFDLVISNPPYLVDAQHRTYRDGGGAFGEALSVRIASEALARLEPGGTLLLYTGTAIVDGEDTFRRAVAPVVARAGATSTYEELDPDVFGEELDQLSYAEVERIAAVVLVATRHAV